MKYLYWLILLSMALSGVFWYGIGYLHARRDCKEPPTSNQSQQSSRSATE